MSIESGRYTFHYLIEAEVAYLTLAEKAYPKKLAFQYLEELQSEFSRLYAEQIEGVTRPYAFIKFGELHRRQPARRRRGVAREARPHRWPCIPLGKAGNIVGRSCCCRPALAAVAAGRRRRRALLPPPIPTAAHPTAARAQTPLSRRPRSCIWTPARSATWPS